MLKLDANPDDDPAFLALAGRLIAGAAVANDLCHLVVVHIDHWFGDRWLGFHGKLLGSAGVRSRRLTDRPVTPPFHPHRVQSARSYRLTETQTFEYYSDWRSLHGYRSSEDNLRQTLYSGVRGTLYAWYSGDTTETDKGVVMVYVVKKRDYAAWYTAFHKAPQWHLGQTVGIAPHKVHEFMDRVE